MLNATTDQKDQKIVLIEELPCEKKLTLNSEAENSNEEKDFTKLLLEENVKCEDLNSSSSSKPSSNLKQSKQIENQKDAILNNLQNTNNENIERSVTTNSEQNSNSSTDLSISRCKQKLNLMSEVELALLEEIQSEKDERKKQGLIKYLADVSGADMDKIKTECFNNT